MALGGDGKMDFVLRVGRWLLKMFPCVVTRFHLGGVLSDGPAIQLGRIRALMRE